MIPLQRTMRCRNPLCATALLAGLGMAASSFGQSPAPSATADQPITLSPFDVKSAKDYGYQASNSITATGIGTPIVDIPANIAVVTKDFINDKNLGELRFAVKHIAGVNSSARDLPADRRSIKVRGFNAPLQQNGYDNAFLSFENTDRVEIIKGPSSVFHGIVRPGGVVNVIKSSASFVEENYAKVEYGSYDYRKSVLHANGPLTDTIAYQVHGAYRYENKRADWAFDEETFWSGSLRWEPSKRVAVFADYENYDLDYRFQSTLPISHPAYVAAVRAGTVPYRQTARAWLDANIGTAEPLGQIFVTGLVYPNGDDKFNPIGPDAISNESGDSFRLESTLKVSDGLDVRAGISRSARRMFQWDHNTFRPVAGQVPGQFIFDSRYNVLRDLSENFTAKIEASYRLKLGAIEQHFVVGASDLENDTFSFNVNGNLRPWNPRTEPIRSGYGEIFSLFPNGLPVTPAPAESKTRSYYVSDQVKLLDGRLHAILGARSTRAQNAAGLKQNEVTPQVGVLFRPLEGIGFFANYSETFEPNYLVDGNRKQVGPTTGEGYDIGVKVDKGDGRISATASVFQVERANIPRRDVPREILTGILPIYILGGVERVAGFEADVIYTPARNLQVVGSYTYNWERETVASTGDVRQVGVPLENVPEQTAYIWGKYTFTEGTLKSTSVGLGATYSSGGQLSASWDVPVKGDAYFVFDAMLGYELPVRKSKVVVQLNLRNLTSEVYNPGVFLRSNPLTAYLSARYAF